MTTLKNRAWALDDRKKLPALTDAEFMKQYWFGVHCECQWTAGPG
jgi:hypothetical protein